MPEILGERIAAAVDGQGIDVLVMEETFGWAGKVQKRVSIPVVVVLHGPWFIYKHWHQKFEPAYHDRERREGEALAVCAGITSPSRRVLEQSLAHYGISGVPSAAIPNPIVPKQAIAYDALDQRARRSILFVGHYNRHKGGDVVIDSFAEMIRRGCDVFLTFVGPDTGVVDADDRIRHIADALAALPDDVRGRINYLGQCDQPEIDELRRQHAIAVVASRAEIFGYVVLESMASGVATIGTNVGGIPEIIRDGQNGLLVPPGDPVALADAVERLLDDPALCEALGVAAHADMVERFSPVKIAGDLVDFLKTLR